MSMSKIEIILTVTTIVSLLTTLKIYKDYEEFKNKGKVKLHKCIYNENTKCYERACGYCTVKNECDFCCEGICDKCQGHKVEYLDKGECENG